MGVMRKLRRKNRDTHYEVEPLRPQQSFPGKKMSEALLDFAEPLLDTFDNDECFEGIISIAAMCWNTSFLPEKEQHKMFRSIVDELGKSDLLTRHEIEDCTRMLLERKKALFADDRRMIVNYKVVDEKDGQRLFVMSTPVKN